MKKSLFLSMILVLTLSITVFSQDSEEFLQGDRSHWYTASILKAGAAEDGTVFIYLKDTTGHFDNWFKAYPNLSVKNRMLTVALKAIELNKHVAVNLSSQSAYSTINRLYILK